MRHSLVLSALCTLPALLAQSPAITYIPGSSVKLYQVNGDCDWTEWDATINNKTPTCKPTASQTLTKADVLGDDVPVVFENNGEMIVTFGDTIGAYNYAAWSDVTNSFQWHAHDPIARSTTANASDGLLLNFFMNGTNPLEVQPPPQADGMAVDMGTDNIPHAGINIDGTIYLGIKTGNINNGTGNNDQSQAYSLLATFNEATQTFTSGRTVSASPNGHFVGGAFYLAAAGQLGTPPPVSPEPIVLNFGIGEERASDIYLSIVPSTEFWTGLDQNGNSATRYFSGMSNGQPTWSSSEAAAVPIVNDPVDPTNPTINKTSVFYSQPLGLWLMMFDNQASSPSTTGMYFTYALQPWGPWSTPQLVFNDCRDKGLGSFIFYYYATAAQNTCPTAMPAGVTAAPGSAGPAGPTIGDQTANNPNTTSGHGYAPALIQRFTVISGSTLKLFYMMATWNPYAVVMMESDFTIAPSPAITLVANAEGESPTIAPNTWVEVKGSNLAPAGDTRTWQSSDFVGGKLPTALDEVSVTVNGQAAYIYYISPTQINILTPPNATTGAVPVVVTVNGSASAAYTVQAQPTSPSFFVINGGPYVLAQHAANYGLVGPSSLYPGSTTPAKPGETVVLYVNGFGQTTTPVVSGSETQSGNLSPLPTVTIGGIAAVVQYAALVSPGLFQLNVVVPANAPPGDNQLVATVDGVTTSPLALITIQSSTQATTANFYVAPNGNDTWSGSLAAPNPAGTDGPFATFDHARAAVAALNKAGLTQLTVQFRGGTYYLPATEQFSATDSGTASTPIVYTNYPNESPVFSGGMRLQGWTNTSGNTWKLTLPSSVKYFENLSYNGARRLRPRLGVALGTFYRIAATVYLPASATNCTVNIPGLGYECFDRFQYNPSDPIAGTWKNLAPAAGNPCNQPAGNAAIAGDIEVLDFEQFSTSKLRISCVDPANHIVYLTGPTPISQDNPGQVGFIAGNRYLVDNVEDDLTQPGQWFLDRSTTPWTLTYLANPGENPNTDTVIAPQIPQLLVASGLEYVTFHGLTFEHDNYTLPALGHPSSELEAEIPGAVSFQNSQHITFDSGTVTQISGTGLEFISCVSSGSPAYCVSNNANAVTANDVIENSAFYDIGALGVRIGDPYVAAFTDTNEPQSMTVQNNVVEAYGRTIPASFGIGQGEGHDNLYTHNDVYDGYHCAISISEQAPDTIKPAGMGNANNTISYNHVWNLLQGIMNDGGSVRIEAGNNAYTAPGNKILNNRIHDVTDASIQDSNGYGGNGIYLDNQTGLVDVENNLVYRVSGFPVYTPQGPAAPNEANIVKNNILAYGRLAMVSVNFPYPYGVPASANQVFAITNNLLYFDRSTASSPKFYVQGGCTYSAGFPYTQFQEWNSNLYWRTDGAFASEPKAFYVQPNPVSTGADAPCSGQPAQWTFYTFSGWRQTVAEDLQSVIQNPGFNNPVYPADDYTLPKGSPGVGFVAFDYTQAGRSNPVLNPPAIPATFLTMTFNPATDY